MRRAALLPALLLVVPLLVACGDDGGGSGRRSYDRYVALGDSFTSGAGTAQPVARSGKCQRTRLNYPTLVSKELHAELVDVSCGGASTANLTTPQDKGDGSSAPPQLDAVTSATDLVTVGLGYNDQSWFAGLVFGCTTLAASDPTGRPCQDAAAANPDPEAVAGQIGAQVEAGLEAVRARAPDAELLLVGYPQLVPAEGRCDDLAIADGDYPYVRAMLELLDDQLRKAAEAAGATYVDVLAASAGHDVCAGDDAWVNGATPLPGVAATYHPFARGQQAVAELVVAALED